MDMQKKDWMDTIHFIEWMDHFIHKLERKKQLLQEKKHLLVLDEHKSCISFNFFIKSKSYGIDMISSLSHISRDVNGNIVRINVYHKYIKDLKLNITIDLDGFIYYPSS